MSLLSLRVALTLLDSPSRALQRSDAGVSERNGAERRKSHYMALNEIYLEIFGFYGSPIQKGS